MRVDSLTKRGVWDWFDKYGLSGEAMVPHERHPWTDQTFRFASSVSRARFSQVRNQRASDRAASETRVRVRVFGPPRAVAVVNSAKLLAAAQQILREVAVGQRRIGSGSSGSGGGARHRHRCHALVVSGHSAASGGGGFGGGGGGGRVARAVPERLEELHLMLGRVELVKRVLWEWLRVRVRAPFLAADA